MKVERYNSVPQIVHQIVEGMIDESNNSQIRYNHFNTLRNIRDYCDYAIERYNKQNNSNRGRNNHKGA